MVHPPISIAPRLSLGCISRQDIDQSAVIVETALDGGAPASQGSHFFQNIISFGVGYMTVDPAAAEATTEVADYKFWQTYPEV